MNNKIENIFRVTLNKEGSAKFDGWQVRIVIDGLHVTKLFSIEKYGYEKALEKAVEYRNEAKFFSYSDKSAADSPTVFLSYAKDDKESVNDIYLALKRSGLSPWMDKPPNPYRSEGLGVGQKWEVVLKEKIKNSDYVMLCISQASLKKRGYVQNEMKQAMKEMASFPEDKEYILPVLLEQCVVPSLVVDNVDLLSLQWFELYEDRVEDLVEQIKKSFKSQG